MKRGIYLVTVLAFAMLFAGFASASGSITSVEVNGIDIASGGTVATFAGETIPLKVVYTPTSDETDVIMNVWLAGSSGRIASTERFQTFAGKPYVKVFSVPVPFAIDPTEDLSLEITVESSTGISATRHIVLSAQRESYITEILDVNMETTVKAGANMPVDIVLKNRGYNLAEDTFVKVTIPALGVNERAYFGDLAPTDRPNDLVTNSRDLDNSAERRLFVSIPANAPAGVYDVIVESYNADSSTTTQKKIAVVASTAENSIVSPISTRTFAPGEKVAYSTTLVNSGDKVALYEIVLSSSSGLTVNTDEPVFAVPAGNGKTIKYEVSAQNAGKYTFTANIYSSGVLVKTETFTANVEGSSKSVAGNATVLLTVVLAIIFVVLLVVLIVLLTRKPEKKEEFGESYY